MRSSNALLVSEIAGNGAPRSIDQARPTRQYPIHYQAKSLEEQVVALTKYFPELKTDAVYNYIRTRLPAELPSGAEGWFAVPRRSAIGKEYRTALIRMTSIMKSYGFAYIWGEEYYDYLFSTDRTLDYLEKIGSRQKGDILIIPAQFGMRFAGQSVAHARSSYEAHEFGLGIFEIGCMLLTNTERLSSPRDLFVDCAGDTYRPAPGPDANRVPYFDFERAEPGECRYINMRFHFLYDGDPIGQYGSATGFLFQ